MIPDLSSVGLAQVVTLIRDRRLTCLALMDHCLARLAASEPAIGAYVAYDIDLARERAADLDRMIERGQWPGPLTGIPFAVKDLFHTEDFPTCAGSNAYSMPVGTPDAKAVQDLKSAGAVLIGKTTTHEFATGLNDLGTGNAWDPERYPGGSSAGSAAAVAVGSAFFALGTDSGGSVRQPAALNGVVGFKPTWGRISEAGVVPLTETLDTVGLLVRHASDCADLLDVLGAGQRVARPASELDGIGVAFPEVVSTDDHVARALADARRALLSSALRVVDIDMKSISGAVETGLTLIQAEAARVHQARLATDGSSYGAPAREFFVDGATLPSAQVRDAGVARLEITHAIDELFAAHGLTAIVTPTISVGTPLLRDFKPTTDLRPFLDHTVIANLTGQPAVTLPARLRRGRMPVGIQLIGRSHQDFELVRVAQVIERLISPAFSEVPLEATERKA